jgi:hypothetical protein
VVRDLIVEGGYAYLADWDGGFRIVDVSDPFNPSEVGTLESMNVWRVALAGPHAYIIEGIPNGDYNLRSIDVSNPAQPVLEDILVLSSGTVWETVIQDDYLYVAHGDHGLRIVDISDPSDLNQVAQYPAPSLKDVDVQGDYAYLASTDWDGGFLIVDVSNPSQPQLISQYNPSGWFHPYHVAVKGAFAYVSRDEELYLFDVSDPAAPLQVDKSYLPLMVTELYVRENRVFVADFWAGLHLLDNTQSTQALQSDKTELLLGTGGYVNFTLSAGVENANRNYLLLGSLSGSVPGLPLPGGLTLPLNWDIFTHFVLGFMNTPFFSDFHGTLNPLGNGTAQFYTMGPPIGMGGQTITFAFALYSPWNFVSNPVEVYIVP